MSWKSGTSLFAKLVDTIEANIAEEEDRVNVYIEMIEAFEDADWDCLHDVFGEHTALDTAINTLYPGQYEPDEEFEDSDEGC